MSSRGLESRGPRWWLVVRLVGAILWALLLLWDIGWGLIDGWPAQSGRGHAPWPILAMEAIFAVAVMDWMWLAWRRLHAPRKPVSPEER